MSMQYPFPTHPLFSAQALPATLISLEEWSLVSVSGADATNYLQGQLTYDITELPPYQLAHAAHCDAKGKTWAHLILFRDENSYYYLIRKSLCECQLAELKKYAVFSKVTITQLDTIHLIGFAGHHIDEKLTNAFEKLPSSEHNVIPHADGFFLYVDLPQPRYLLISHQTPSQTIPSSLQSLPVNNSQQWLMLDIEAGFAIVEPPTSTEFLPQSLNLQAINAISFSKGCYRGQEMVARAKYRGINKRALYLLTGSGQRTPEVGEELEWQLESGWRKTGTVLAAVKTADNQLWIQAVMSNDLEQHSVFRLNHDEQSRLSIAPLPYSLSEQEL